MNQNGVQERETGEMEGKHGKAKKRGKDAKGAKGPLSFGGEYRHVKVYLLDSSSKFLLNPVRVWFCVGTHSRTDCLRICRDAPITRSSKLREPSWVL